MSACACGSGRPFEDCCDPLLAGHPAPTAEALMRSRYTAYVVGRLDHVERTNTPEACTDFDRLDSERFAAEANWLGLKILRVVDGGPDDTTGQVEFTFRYKHHGKVHMQHELAYFCRRDGQWLYEHSEMNPKGEPVRVSKINRNDPCPCGSGKKHKKCCGAA